MRKVIPVNEQGIILEIENEHKPVLELFDKFVKAATMHKQYATKNTREAFVGASKAVI